MAATAEVEDLQEKLKKKGWNVTLEGITECVKALGQAKCTEENLIKSAADFDLKEIGSKVLTEYVKRGQAQSVEGPIVLQIQKVRNVSAPTANEESSTAPRLLKIQLTDGHTTCSALENSFIRQLSLSMPPGTKVRLKGTIPICNSFLMLEPGRIEVVGGKVEKMLAKWEANRSITKQVTRSGIDSEGPPSFISFGVKGSVSTKKAPDKETTKKTQESSSIPERNSDNERNSKKIQENPNYNQNQRNHFGKYGETDKTQNNSIKTNESGSKFQGVNRRQGEPVEYKKAPEQKRPFTSTGSDQMKRNTNTQGKRHPTFQNRNESAPQSDSTRRILPRKGESQDDRSRRRDDGQKGFPEKHDRRKKHDGGRKNDDDYYKDDERAEQGTLWDFLEHRFPTKETKKESIVPESSAENVRDRPGEESKSWNDERGMVNKMENSSKYRSQKTDGSSYAECGDGIRSSDNNKGWQNKNSESARDRKDEPMSGKGYGNRQNEREYQWNRDKYVDNVNEGGNERKQQGYRKTDHHDQGFVGNGAGRNRDTKRVDRPYCASQDVAGYGEQEPRQCSRIDVGKDSYERKSAGDNKVDFGNSQDGRLHETFGREKYDQSSRKQNDKKDVKNTSRNEDRLRDERSEDSRRQQGYEGDLRGTAGPGKQNQSNKRQNNDNVDFKNASRNEDGLRDERGEDRRRQQGSEGDLRGTAGPGKQNQSNKKQNDKKQDIKNFSRNDERVKHVRNEDGKQDQGSDSSLREKKQNDKVDVKNASRNEERFQHERSEDKRRQQGSQGDVHGTGVEKQNQSNKGQNNDNVDFKNASRNEERFQHERSEDKRRQQGSQGDGRGTGIEKQNQSNKKQNNKVDVRNTSRSEECLRDDGSENRRRPQQGSEGDVRGTAGPGKQNQSNKKQNDKVQDIKIASPNEDRAKHERSEDGKKDEVSDSSLRETAGLEKPNQSNRKQNGKVDVKNASRNEERFRDEGSEDKRRQKGPEGDLRGTGLEKQKRSNEKQNDKIVVKNTSRNEERVRHEGSDDRRRQQGSQSDLHKTGPEKQNQSNKKQNNKVDAKNTSRNEERFRHEGSDDRRRQQGSQGDLRGTARPEKQNQSNKKHSDKVDVKNGTPDKECVQRETKENGGETQNKGPLDCNKQFSETKNDKQRVGNHESKKGGMSNSNEKYNHDGVSLEGKRPSGMEQSKNDGNSVAYSSTQNNPAVVHSQRPATKHWWKKGDQCFALCSQDYQYHLASVLSVEVRLRSCHIFFPDINTEEMIQWSYLCSLQDVHNNYNGQIFLPSHSNPSYYQPTTVLYSAHPAQNQWVHHPSGSFQPHFLPQGQNQTANTRYPAFQDNDSKRRPPPRPTRAFYQPPSRD